LETATHLKATLGTVQLWAIAVGLVISGEYFGWSYGWASAGTLGFLVTTLFVATMYTAFIFSFTELTTSILNVQFPALSPRTAAVLAYFVFMLLNIVGVQIAAAVELFVTLLAIAELLVFMAVVAPGAHLSNFVSHGWGGSDHLSPHLFGGMFAAMPFAIWFFLAIEGVAMAAEEIRDPRRSIPIAYLAGIGTLLLLALGVMLFAGSAGDWRVLANINDPLPQAMKMIVGARSGWLHMLVWLGLFGLVASFHGIILGYSRQIYALARAGYLPGFLGVIHPRFRTPWIAILAGGAVGIASICSDTFVHFGGQPLTANIVTVSALGALLSTSSACSPSFVCANASRSWLVLSAPSVILSCRPGRCSVRPLHLAVSCSTTVLSRCCSSRCSRLAMLHSVCGAGFL
jgi:ethanolamine permease